MNRVFMKFGLVFTFFLCLWAFSASAQQDTRINPNTSSLSNVERMIMPYQDNKQLLQEELAARAPGRAPHFAVPMDVFITPDNHGTWEFTEDDMAVWRMRIYSQGAKSLNLGFTKYYMPPGGSLVLYAPDYSEVQGPFTPADNEEHQQLWTPILRGDEIVIEVQVPIHSMEDLQLELKYVNHDFMGFGQMAESLLSGSCNLDVICGDADGWGIVDDYRDIIQSVAVYGLSGSTFCTGFLVNNTNQDCTPYFMTADHCGINSGNAASLVAYWNYQNSTCREPGSPASGAPGDGTLNDFNTGAIFRAGYSPSDFTLVELDDPVSETADAFFAGWSAEPVAHDTAICVHHPNTDEKRISFEFDPGMLTQAFNSTPSPNDYTHVRVVDWDIGTTEPGSSGSPLFDQNKRVIGQLTGGGAACGNNESDWFGAISISWEGGGTPTTRLKDWLDPNNTGVLVLDGRSQLQCSYAVTPQPASQQICAPADATYTLEISAAFEGPVTLSIADIPVGANASFSANPADPDTEVSLTISGTGGLSAGSYTMTITGTDGTNDAQSEITLVVVTGLPPLTALTSPADAATDITVTPVFTWEASSASAYDIQVATDPAFTQIVASATDVSGTEWPIDVALNPTTSYYWRVKGKNVCGEGDWSSAFTFTTANIACGNFFSLDVPLTIISQGTPTITSTMEVNMPGTIEDVNVVNLQGTHTWVGDLSFTLTSPSGTTVILVDAICDDMDDFDVSFDDEADGPPPCPYNDGGTYTPLMPLSAFDGEPASGTWTLTVIDNADEDGGILENWGLGICVIPSAAVSLTLQSAEICVGESLSFDVGVSQGYQNDVTLTVSGLPTGASADISPNPVAPGGSATVALSGLDAAGTYSITVTGDDGANTADATLALTLNPATEAANLTEPPDEATSVDVQPDFSWEAVDNVDGYIIEIASDPQILTLVESGTTPTNSYSLNATLDPATTYYWRVTASGPCGTATSDIFSFTTGTTGTNELAGRSLSVHPNPATEKIILRLSAPLDSELQAELFDAQGRSMGLQTFAAGTVVFEWPVANLPEGVYLMRLRAEDASLVRRIVVQH